MTQAIQGSGSKNALSTRLIKHNKMEEEGFFGISFSSRDKLSDSTSVSHGSINLVVVHVLDSNTIFAPVMIWNSLFQYSWLLKDAKVMGSL